MHVASSSPTWVANYEPSLTWVLRNSITCFHPVTGKAAYRFARCTEVPCEPSLRSRKAIARGVLRSSASNESALKQLACSAASAWQ